MKKPRTKKQKEFFRELAKGETPRLAAIKAGYASSGAGHIAAENTKNYTEYWQKMLDEAGATDSFISQTIFEGLKAVRVVGYLQSRNKETNAKIEPDECISNDYVEVADYQSRAKFTDIALKLKNAYPANKVELAGKNGGPVQVEFV